MLSIARAFIVLTLFALPAAAADWPPAPTAPGITGSLGYTKLPGAAYNPDPKHTYKIVFDITKPAAKPTEAAEGIALAATELDQLRGNGVPAANTKFALVFHGGALDSILNNETYKSKHGTDNPNLPILAALKKEGVALLVCGQMLVITKTDPKTIAKDVTLGSDALLMLATLQNEGYALLSF